MLSENGLKSSLSLNINQKEKINIQFGINNTKLNENSIYPNNNISTTKYTLLTFFPKCLLFQFIKLANIYFLIISILCFFDFSPTNPIPQIGTFIFVIFVSMIKEAWEDYQRYKLDKIPFAILSNLYRW